MLVARALVLGLNTRAALAMAVVAMSVAYAVLTSAAVGGLQDASSVLNADLVEPRQVLALPDLAPFDAAWAPAGSTLFVHVVGEAVTLGTQQPWPHDREAVPGPYARLPSGLAERLGIPVVDPTPHEAPWNWVLLPPDVFAALAPEMAGKATLVLAPAGASAPALVALPTPAAGTFYESGARQVVGSIHLVIAAMGLTVAVLAGSVLRLEVLAREADLAALEAIGGAEAARHAVLLRTLFLVGTGTAAGAALGLLLTRVAGRVLGDVGLRVDPFLLFEAIAVAFAAGMAAGALGGLARLRVPVGARLGRRNPPSRRFPGPVRFLLVTPRLTPSVLAAALVMTSVSAVVLAAGSVPTAVFEPDDGTLVVGQSPGNPFRGSADRFLGEHATLLEGIHGSSPETIAPTIVAGRPVVVRGVAFEGWRSVDEVHIERGRWPSAPDEATVGARLSRVSGLGPGDHLLVPGAYRPTARALVIVGVHAGGGLLEDEVVTDLDAAGDLAALPRNTVHWIRLRADAAGANEALGARLLVVTNLTVDPPRPVPFTEATARVHVLNLDERPAQRTLLLHVNGVVEAAATARLPPHGEGEASFAFRVPDTPNLTLEINPTTQVATGSPGLTIRAPDSVGPNTTFTARVLDAAGQAVPGAHVTARQQGATTDAQGEVSFASGPPGLLPLTARFGDLEGGQAVYVVEAAWALSPHVAAERAFLSGPGRAEGERVRYDVAVALTNLGGADFAGNIEALAGNATVGTTAASVAARGQVTIALAVILPREARSFEVLGLVVPVTPPPAEPTPGTPPLGEGPPGSALETPGPAPRTVADVLRERREVLAARAATRSLSGQVFLEEVFATLQPSIVLVVIATYIHAGAAVAVAVLRELRERADVAAVLGDLGATPDQLAARGMRDALLSVLPGLFAGGLGATLVLAALGPWGFPAAFGHTIPVPPDLGFLVRVVGGLALVAVAAAAWGARAPPESPPRQAVRRLVGELLEET